MAMPGKQKNRKKPHQTNLRISDIAKACLRNLARKDGSTLTEALERAIRAEARRQGVYPEALTQ